MPRKRTVRAAAIYCRISHDHGGEGLGVKRQEALCAKLAAEKGWPVTEVYVDNDVSAFNGKRRASYERMLTDLEAGQRDAVICVDVDRLTRRPAELEAFMELADAKGIALANVAGDTDLSTSDGRFKARIMGAVARQESEKKAERVSREAEDAARRGVPRGSRRCYGYAADRVTIDTEEAERIREAARRVMAGESVPAIARDWNEQGVPTTQGAARGWSASALVGILRNPRIAGLRTYKGEIVAEGAWPAILERSAWQALQGRIRRVSRVGRPSSHLLSGILRCKRCESPMWTSWKLHRGERIARYACIKRPGHPGCGKTTIVAKRVDDVVREAVIFALTGPKLTEARRRAADRGDDEAKAAAELADAEGRREEMASMFAAGDISRREWLAGREKLDERIRAATRILDRQSGRMLDLPDSEDALRKAWERGDLEWRRAVITSVLEAVVIKPATPSPRFDPDRVGFLWRV